MAVEFDFAGRTVLVTGASKGIGRGIAEAFGAAGARVAINYRSDAAGAEATADAVRALGGEALTLPADVGQPEAVAAMFATLDAEFGRLDVLVNNAGIGGGSRLLHETPFADWERIIRANLHGPFLCAGEAARRMVARGEGGRIVNITSVHEEACNAVGGGAYCAAKGGLRNLTRSLALELAPHGITVNAVAPGMILTPMNQRALDDAGYREWAEAQIPVQRGGTPADVAAMVLFLCSDVAAYCTGGSHLVDGGWMLTWPPV